MFARVLFEVELCWCIKLISDKAMGHTTLLDSSATGAVCNPLYSLWRFVRH